MKNFFDTPKPGYNNLDDLLDDDYSLDEKRYLNILNNLPEEYFIKAVDDLLPLIESLHQTLRAENIDWYDIKGRIFLPTGTDRIQSILSHFFSSIAPDSAEHEVIMSRWGIAEAEIEKLKGFLDDRLNSDQDHIIIFDDTVYSGKTLHGLLDKISPEHINRLLVCILAEDNQGNFKDSIDSLPSGIRVIMNENVELSRYTSRYVNDTYPEFTLPTRTKIPVGDEAIIKYRPRRDLEKEILQKEAEVNAEIGRRLTKAFLALNS